MEKKKRERKTVPPPPGEYPTPQQRAVCVGDARTRATRRDIPAVRLPKNPA